MGLFGRNKDVCKGRFGMIEDEDGERTKGIEANCPGHDERVVATGDRDEAEAKFERFLEDEDMTAKVRNDL